MDWSEREATAAPRQEAATAVSGPSRALPHDASAAAAVPHQSYGQLLEG